jgi:hypothetical protein
MKRLVSLLFVVVLSWGLGACYRTHLIFDGVRDPQLQQNAKHTTIHRTFVIGLWELDGPLPVDAICPTGISYAYQRLGGWSWVVAAISGGIVDARDVDIVCRDGSRASLRIELRKGKKKVL